MKTRNLTVPIILFSVLIPAVVASLFLIPRPENHHIGFNLKILPLFNAILNSCTAMLLLGSLFFIRRGQWKIHRAFNLIAVGLSVLFLVSYVIYHALAPETRFGGKGWIRPVYFFILISHITLSAIIIPFVLVTLTRALKGDFVRHRRIARITWPLWFYVAVTGVLVYIMLSPYY